MRNPTSKDTGAYLRRREKKLVKKASKLGDATEMLKLVIKSRRTFKESNEHIYLA